MNEDESALGTFDIDISSKENLENDEMLDNNVEESLFDLPLENEGSDEETMLSKLPKTKRRASDDGNGSDNDSVETKKVKLSAEDDSVSTEINEDKEFSEGKDDNNNLAASSDSDDDAPLSFMSKGKKQSKNSSNESNLAETDNSKM